MTVTLRRHFALEIHKEYLSHSGGCPIKKHTIKLHPQAAVPETCRFMGARTRYPPRWYDAEDNPHSRNRLPSATYTSAPDDHCMTARVRLRTNAGIVGREMSYLSRNFCKTNAFLYCKGT